MNVVATSDAHLKRGSNVRVEFEADFLRNDERGRRLRQVLRSVFESGTELGIELLRDGTWKRIDHWEELFQ